MNSTPKEHRPWCSQSRYSRRDHLYNRPNRRILPQNRLASSTREFCSIHPSLPRHNSLTLDSFQLGEKCRSISILREESIDQAAFKDSEARSVSRFLEHC